MEFKPESGGGGGQGSLGSGRYLLVAGGYPGFTDFRPGGLPSYARLVATALLSRGWFVDVLCVVHGDGPLPSPRTEGRLTLQAVRLPAVHWRIARFQPVIHGMVLGRAVAALVRADTSAIELPHLDGIAWAAILRYRNRILLRLHTSARQHASFGQVVPDAADRAAWRWDRRCARWSRRLVVATAAHAHEMAQELGIPTEAFTIIAHGAPPMDPPSERKRSQIQRVLFVGAMEERKGVDRFIRSAEAAQTSGLAGSVRWTIVGRPAEPWAARALAAGIDCMGRVNEQELSALWDESAVVVVPSRYESFGLVAIEAMMRGVPVVASNIPVFQEVLADSALLVDAGKPDTLLDAVGRVLNNRDCREELVTRGTQRFDSHFTFSVFAARLGSALREILK